MTTTTWAVTGMTCEHCVRAVTDELTALDGVTDVSVELARGATSTATVTATREVTPEEVRTALDEAGYSLADVR